MKTVAELMHKQIVGVAQSATVEMALRLMRAAHVTLLPVLEDSHLVGILTRSAAEGAEGKKVKEAMKKPIFVEANSPLDEAAKRMLQSSMPRIPVVNNSEERICIGMITSTEIANEIKKQ